MTRGRWVRLASAAFLLLLMASATSAQAKTVIRIAHESSVEHNIHKALLFFAKVAAEKTKGDVEVRVFPSGQLGDERAILEGVKIGTIDSGSAGGLYTTIDPRFALLREPCPAAASRSCRADTSRIQAVDQPKNLSNSRQVAARPCAR